jgi:hypothetical protein
MSIRPKRKQAAEGRAELGYIAMAYISGRSIAAMRILVLLAPVTYSAKRMQPIRKMRLDTTVMIL